MAEVGKVSGASRWSGGDWRMGVEGWRRKLGGAVNKRKIQAAGIVQVAFELCSHAEQTVSSEVKQT